MTTSTTDADSAQADAEGAEGGDKPPHASPPSTLNGISSSSSNHHHHHLPVASPSSEKTVSPLNGVTCNYTNGVSSHNNNPTQRSSSGSSVTPSNTSSPVHTLVGSEGQSSPIVTRNASRTASQSSEKTGTVHERNFSPPKHTLKQAIVAVSPPSSRPTPAPPSDTHSQKFSLKDLLGATPSLSRRTSNRSASTRRSDSERGASSMGETSGSLAKKYGVCERLAIGKGATSVVRLVHKWDRSEEKLYAVKEFRKRRKNETEKEYVKKLTAEFCISSTLHHPNVVETVDLVQDEQQRWCEVMEYCPGGDLYAAIKKGAMSTSEVECCFKQIISGVDYLHSQGVAHRDLKPENLYFDVKGALKIGDYGASTVYRLPWESTVHLSTGLCGSEPYIAPEQFSGKPYDARLVDVWACGIIYYCMQFQELPWRVAQPAEMLYAAYAQAAATTKADGAAGSCPAALNSLQPRASRSVIRRMLEPDPKKRWHVKDILAHNWSQGIEVCTVAAKPTHVHCHARAMLQIHAAKMQESHRTT